LPVDVSSQSHNLHILCVDNNAAELRLRGRLLQAEGYAVTLARSPSLALRLDCCTFGLIVLDFHLDEMNGLQLFFHLRQRHVACPIVLLSDSVANLLPDTTVLFSACLDKSGPPGVLLDTIRSFVNSATLPDFPPRDNANRHYARHRLQLLIDAGKHGHLLQEID
jgi:CheY-like chemotaxis protein